MIYVDNLITYPGKGRWCHMATDGDIAELHNLARRIGLKRGWFQERDKVPHYDLRPSKRALAVEAGAVEVDGVTLFKQCQGRR